MTRVDALAALFTAKPNTWIDGRELSQHAGCYAWRTRISDLRRPPFNWRIVNRQRRVRRTDGGEFVISEYRFEAPESRDREEAADGVSAPPAAM